MQGRVLICAAFFCHPVTLVNTHFLKLFAFIFIICVTHSRNYKYKEYICVTKQKEIMKNTIIKGLTVTFDKVVDFKQLGTDCFECFFFKNEELLGSKFLTAIELKELK